MQEMDAIKTENRDAWMKLATEISHTATVHSPRKGRWGRWPILVGQVKVNSLIQWSRRCFYGAASHFQLHLKVLKNIGKQTKSDGKAVSGVYEANHTVRI